MDKITFLNELETELDDLPRKEKDKVMNEYENIFYNQETKGKTDAQILDDLKNPYTIGKEIKAKEAISHAKVTPNFRNIVKAIMASLSLGVISFFLIVIPMIIFLIFLAFVFVISIVLICLPILLIIISILKGTPDSLSNFLYSISYAGIGILVFVAIIKIVQNLYKLVLKYLSWYIKIIKGRIQ